MQEPQWLAQSEELAQALRAHPKPPALHITQDISNDAAKECPECAWFETLCRDHVEQIRLAESTLACFLQTIDEQRPRELHLMLSALELHQILGRCPRSLTFLEITSFPGRQDLLQLGACTALQRLHVHTRNDNGAGLLAGLRLALAGTTALTCLVWSHDSNSGFGGIFGLLGGASDDAGIAATHAAIGALPRLQRLTLNGCAATMPDPQPLARATTLTRLAIFEAKARDVPGICLALPALSSLQDVDIRSREECVDVTLPCVPQLREILLIGIALDADSCAALEGICELEVLSMANGGRIAAAPALVSLKQFMHMGPFAAWDAEEERALDEAEHVAHVLAAATGLTALVLSAEFPAKAAAYERLTSTVAGMSSLQRLALDRVELIDAMLPKLSALTGLAHLALRHAGYAPGANRVPRSRATAALALGPLRRTQFDVTDQLLMEGAVDALRLHNATLAVEQ